MTPILNQLSNGGSTLNEKAALVLRVLVHESNQHANFMQKQMMSTAESMVQKFLSNIPEEELREKLVTIHQFLGQVLDSETLTH